MAARTLGPREAEIAIYAFKEGVLAAAAHDVKLRVGAFTLVVDDDAGTIEADVGAASLSVVCAMQGGREAPGVLGASARADLERNVRDDVLHSKRHPRVTFSGRATGDALVGTLTLHGVSREVWWARRGDAAEVELDQRDFGLVPYTALFGTLRVKPRVRIVVTLT